VFILKRYLTVNYRTMLNRHFTER